MSAGGEEKLTESLSRLICCLVGTIQESGLLGFLLNWEEETLILKVE